jgi:hypothetical protein
MTGSIADDLAVAALALARRFAAGATMWCVSPRWPAHGRHIAVEFVHPVIVGKRALPALHVDGADLVATVRLLARPGDIIVAVGGCGDAVVHDVLRRADPWGLTSLWLGAGRRPPAGAADHVLWIEDADPDIAILGGDLVVLYHLLWELTHVVFEHPGLVRPEAACAEDVCITCSDEGRLAEVTTVGRDGRAVVLAGGGRETIDISLVEPVAPGDLVLVHAGVALAALPERRA